MQDTFLIAGFGGQGVMFLGQLIAYTGMDEGLEVTWIPSYGPEMRGGTAHCMVVLSDKPIGSPVFANPDVAVVFNIPSHEKYAPIVKAGGLLVTNSTLITAPTTRSDIQELRIPATEIADKIGTTRLANIVLLGAILAVNPVLSIDAIKLGLDGHIPAHHRDMLPLNLEALEQGAEFALELVMT